MKMIEILNKKRVILAFGLVLVLCFSTYIIKAHWTYTRQLAAQEQQIKSKVKSAARCESFTSLSRCQRCPKDELRNLASYCMETGFKEEIQCPDGKKDFVWCDISPAVEESDFWRFQLIWLLFALSSYTVVYLRQRKLDKILMEKIHKQISSGV